MQKILSVLTLLTTLFIGQVYAGKVDTQDSNIYPKVKLETSLGDIVIELNRRKAPITVKNFIDYVVKGEYNGVIFHRVIEGFIVQSGGYDKDYNEKPVGEPIFNESGNGLKNESMTIAMARMSDPHSAVRQFFFNVADNENLDPGRNWGYCVFGIVEQGDEIITKISQVETNYNEQFGSADVPVNQIVIKKASLLPRN